MVNNKNIIASSAATIMAFFLLLTLCACSLNDKYEKPDSCEDSWEPNISLSNLLSLYDGETIRIQEDWIVEGYVISSDREGNFYGRIHIQDHPQEPAYGLELMLELPDASLFYPAGQAILISLKGLYLGKSNGSFQLGGVYGLFDQLKVGRLPGRLAEQHIQSGCAESIAVIPRSISLEKMEQEQVNTLVAVDSVQFPEDLLGHSYAEEKEETSRQLEDCNGNTINLVNSGYADFAPALLPEGSGKVTGILLGDGKDFSLVIRSISDVEFTKERCPSGPEPRSSDNLIISEIADPENNTEARFIELYNAGEEELPLVGWTLERYTNANLQVGVISDLTELSIQPKGVVVIASNAITFEEVYGFPPNWEGGKNSAADSNGDDNMVLRDPFGMIKDVFGRIGADGSNTDHEFEDGRALRNKTIFLGNPAYNPGEWIIFNDTGGNGTINQPQIAPGDFTPGEH